MTVVVSMLRGINLGRRQIKMEALRALYTSIGLSGAQTYIQSGNVIFRTKERNLVQLNRRIEDEIERCFGFRVNVIARTCSELRDVIASNVGLFGINPPGVHMCTLRMMPGAPR